jgi:Tol biopolymer transport system component
MIYSTDDTIFIADVRTKSVRELFSNSSVVIRSPFVSRDGKLLYYTAANLESDIWLLDLSEEK